MGSTIRRIRRHVSGTTPLAAFLVATLALALWLGYQAVDAALSHRRTAESVLKGYALISASEMARLGRSEMEDFLGDVFAPLTDRRRDPVAAFPEGLARGLRSAARSQGCACPDLRAPLALFRVDGASGAVEVLPDSLLVAVRDGVMPADLGARPTRGRNRRGMLTAAVGGEPVAVGYLVSQDPDGVNRTVYGFVASAAGVGQLFRHWYEGEPLLPRAIAGEQPNDSLLHVTVRDAAGRSFFASPVGYAAAVSAEAALPSAYGGFVVEAAVRSDAASQLVIGGLPSSRLSLVAALLLLTLGLGGAAFVQLRREQEFQKLREDFVSGVSHELRTPLAQIRMFAELTEGGKLSSEADRRRAVAVIHRESRRLSHLVENILQFSRLRRSPGQGMPRERVDFAEALADGLDAVTPLLEDRAMKLQLAIRPGLPVRANREAITRIIVNLLDNAVKYGPRGQTVRVGLERVNGSARLSVADEGPGVPPQDRERVWKPYRRLERDVKAQHPGTGIGLSVVSELAALSDGLAWVEDAPGGGARFVIELPLASPETGGES